MIDYLVQKEYIYKGYMAYQLSKSKFKIFWLLVLKWKKKKRKKQAKNKRKQTNKKKIRKAEVWRPFLPVGERGIAG